MAEITNIMIAGVGGQGTVLAGRILSLVAQQAGYDVKVSEIHGMSQRGGSVVTQVRYGQQVAAPIIPFGEVDYLLAFEKLEALRMLPQLHATRGKMIVNSREMPPMPVLAGAAEYPADIEAKLTAAAQVVFLDAFELALKAGNAKAVNTVLLGKLSQNMEFPEDAWIKALEEGVKPKFLELNKKAFALGRNS